MTGIPGKGAEGADAVVSVPVNVTNNAQISELGKLKAADVKAAMDAKTAGWTFGEAKTAATDTDGKIDWSNLSLGVYLLEETGTSDAHGNTYKGSAPSLIFLPTTNPKGDGWIMDGENYGVWVYPKNAPDTNENKKAVEDTNKQVGQTITYTISGTVPTVQKLSTEVNGRTYNLNEYGFWDNLDEKLLLENTDSVAVSYGVAAGDAQLAQLTKDTDYVAQIVTTQGAAADSTSQVLVVRLTDSGLQKVAVAKAENEATEVFLTFSPKVIASGIVPNKAVVVKNTGAGKGNTTPEPNTPPDEPSPKPPSNGGETNKTVSGWGDVEFTKTNPEGAALQGAEFQVYGVKNGEIDYKSGAISASGKTTFVSDKNGHVAINGLHANNLEDNASPVSDEQYESYALVETKAPEGYELLREPIKFVVNVSEVTTVTSEATWKFDENGNLISSTEKVTTTTKQLTSNQLGANDKLEPFANIVNIEVKPQLPLTGGQGVALFGVLGLAIVLGGVAYARRNSSVKA
ncbi:MAG: SpaH/EbpB family LPXTG-anchored major pilin [Actinomycetaceae bacterium]|nr:SpaH/EbpB family LPXTG-anchored major pilin [Actinomycetaceae bacterium]MDY6082528.1 SpaH/EbpB family LPXTG-anchored major pilin [Actinomycetaceae bacterium]